MTAAPASTPHVSPANLTAAPTNASARAGLSWEDIVRELHGAVHRIKQDAWLQWGLLTGLSGSVSLVASITAYLCVKRRCCAARRCCRRSAYRLQDSRVDSTTPSHGSGGSAGRDTLATHSDSHDGTYEEIELSPSPAGSQAATAATARADDSSSEDTVMTFCPPGIKFKRK